MEAAMNQTRDKYEFRIRWHPFLLRPDMPEEGVPKTGQRVSAHLQQAGQAVGIDFTGKTPVYPNTLKAHVLLDFVKDNLQLQDQLSEVLFKAYFTDGCALDADSLVRLAESAGIKREEAAAAIKDQNRLSEAYQTARSWSNRGISGVPYFYMNNQKTFSGAQDSSAFVRMFEIIAEKFPAPETVGGANM